MTKIRADSSIIGGGMVGATMALALARQGLRIQLLDKTPPHTQLTSIFDGRVSAISYGSWRMFQKLGLWEDMCETAQPIWDIRVLDHDSPTHLHYDHKEVGDAPFGYIVENRSIRQSLFNAIQKESNITLQTPVKVADITTSPGNVTITLENGDTMESPLLIAADGRHSMVRRHLSIPTQDVAYTQTAIVCTIEHEKPHHGLALEKFFPVGPFAVLPMQANRSSLVWTEPHTVAKHMVKLSKASLEQQIQNRVGEYLGKITLAGKTFTHPLSLVFAERYTDTRVALIGDAAHAIHPIAGQGINLGLRDVAVLAEVIETKRKLGSDVGGADILEHYARWRHTDALAMIAVTDGMNRLFSTPFPPIKLARNLGLWAVGKSPPLKKFFMRHAMGIVGHLPELMKEEKQEMEVA